MRLLNVKTFRLEEFLDYEAPKYAILSHTWGNDWEEVTFRNVEEGNIDKSSAGWVKLQGCCLQAEKDGLGYAWIDTCCIDKTNLVELSEAINSMFRWYRRASVCYAYLSDVADDDHPREHESAFRGSRWFRRGWTLQELLAPKQLRFYNLKWHCLGTKRHLCDIIREITGVPSQFLWGITELYTASVAQRMSWAAQRDTKRKEDLAYCLLGLFGVTMPMIYGEGGDQAFFRLQEQILKTTRDDSILAWDLGVQEASTSNSGNLEAGRILAVAPSRFANSGQIVSREQPTMSLHSLDISGGSLRIHLSLLTTSASSAIGLLNCGPEHDMGQVVGIPLVNTTEERSNEYVRPRGCSSVLQPITASSASPQLIYIKNDSQSSMSADTGRHYWLYDDFGFAKLQLDLVDVFPRSRWDKEQALIMLIIKSDDGATHRTLVRFRHDKGTSPDFVMVLEFEQQCSGIEAQCCVMVCHRNTDLEDLAGKVQYMRRKVSGKRGASNGLLNLGVTWEPVMQQPMFIVRPEAMPHPPDFTVNATVELQKLNLMLEFITILEEKWQSDSQKWSKIWKKNRKGNMMRRRMIREGGDDSEEWNDSEEVNDAEEDERWSHTQKRWDEFRRINGGEDGYKLKRTAGQTPLRWAVENNYIEMVELLLVKTASAAVANVDSWMLLITACKKGHIDVVQLLLATSGNKSVDLKMADAKMGRTALLWAAEKGHEAIVQLLLEKGANIEAKDYGSQTALLRAAKKGHETIVCLLLENGADIEAKNYWGQTALLQAAKMGHETIVCLLLENGADIEAAAAVEVEVKDAMLEDMWGRTALSWAAENGHEGVVRQLLEKGAEVDIKDYLGRTPFFWAVKKNNEAILRLVCNT